VLSLLAVNGCGPASFLITPVSPSVRLQEKEVLRESVWASKKIALIDVTGVISNAQAPSLFGPAGDNPVVRFKEKLDKAAGDRHVRAVVLRINSPGGGVTASALMYDELVRFKKKTGKPVITYMMDVAASGGYYLACATDKIFAHRTTVTGSIGVIMISPDLSGAMKKLGIRANVIKSGKMKDAGSPFRAMETDDRALFQTMIDGMYERFLEVVAAGRPGIDKNKLREIADGRVYGALEAKTHGLIDEIGGIHDAIAAARSAADLGDRKIVVVEYARRMDYRPNVHARTADTGVQVNLVHIALPDWLRSPSPQFMYLWAPGW
jgi:protease-4